MDWLMLIGGTVIFGAIVIWIGDLFASWTREAEKGGAVKRKQH